MSTVPIGEQIKCLDVECERRKRVYPRLIESGKMTAEEAMAEIARMDAARQTLAQLRGLAGR